MKALNSMKAIDKTIAEVLSERTADMSAEQLKQNIADVEQLLRIKKQAENRYGIMWR